MSQARKYFALLLLFLLKHFVLIVKHGPTGPRFCISNKRRIFAFIIIIFAFLIFEKSSTSPCLLSYIRGNREIATSPRILLYVREKE